MDKKELVNKKDGWYCKDCEQVWYKKTEKCPTCGSADIEYFDLKLYDQIN